MNQLLLIARLQAGIFILEVIDRALQQRIVVVKIHDAVRPPPDGENVHAPVIIPPRNFQNFRRATNMRYAIRQSQEHPKWRFFVQALAHHPAIARLENVQGKKLAGEKYDVERKERDAIWPHVCQRP